MYRWDHSPLLTPVLKFAETENGLTQSLPIEMMVILSQTTDVGIHVKKNQDGLVVEDLQQLKIPAQKYEVMVKGLTLLLLTAMMETQVLVTDEVVHAVKRQAGHAQGGTTTVADTCTEICGDGKRFNSVASYCDDGDTVLGMDATVAELKRQDGHVRVDLRVQLIFEQKCAGMANDTNTCCYIL